MNVLLHIQQSVAISNNFLIYDAYREKAFKEKHLTKHWKHEFFICLWSSSFQFCFLHFRIRFKILFCCSTTRWKNKQRMRCPIFHLLYNMKGSPALSPRYRTFSNTLHTLSLSLSLSHPWALSLTLHLTLALLIYTLTFPSHSPSFSYALTAKILLFFFAFSFSSSLSHTLFLQLSLSLSLSCFLIKICCGAWLQQQRRHLDYCGSRSKSVFVSFPLNFCQELAQYIPWLPSKLLLLVLARVCSRCKMYHIVLKLTRPSDALIQWTLLLWIPTGFTLTV